MSFTPGDPRGPSASLREHRDLPGDPLARPARGTGSVLVTGGTGRVGRVVCALLNERRESHRALVRAGSDQTMLGGDRTWLIDGDLRSPRSLSPPLEGVDTVLHLAGLVRTGDAAALRAVHVEGTRALMEAARAAGVRRVVAISSDTVLRARRSAYAESKAEMESVLHEAAGDGLDVVVLRPPMILGPGSPHLASLAAMASRRVAVIPPGAAPRAPVHVDDVARAVLAARTIDVPGGYMVLDLPGAEAVTFAALLGAVARARGLEPPPVIEAPAALMGPGLRIARLLGARGRRLAERLEGLSEAVSVDPEPARALLGWQPRSLSEVVSGG